MICVDEVSWMRVGLQEEVINEKEIADRKFTDVVAKAEAEAKHRGVELVNRYRHRASSLYYCCFHRAGRL